MYFHFEKITGFRAEMDQRELEWRRADQCVEFHRDMAT